MPRGRRQRSGERRAGRGSSCRAPRASACRRARITERLGNPAAQQPTSLIAIARPRHPRRLSRGRARRGDAAASRPDLKRTARICGTCRSSPSIRRMRATMTTRSGPSPTPIPRIAGGWVVIVAIADVAAYVRPGTRARPRGAASAATRSISPTASCRCCRSASPTISAR